MRITFAVFGACAATLVLLLATESVAQPTNYLPSGVTNAPPTVVGNLRGLRNGSTLNVSNGGVVGNEFRTGAGTLNVTGGTVGSDLSVDGGRVQISGGTVGSRFDARPGSRVTISGGSVGSFFEAGNYFGSDETTVVNITGGSLGSYGEANDKAIINISGGSIGSGFEANEGSQVNLTGGSISGFEAHSGSELNIAGGRASHVSVESGSVVNISGGVVESTFLGGVGSTVNVSGGIIAGHFSASHVDFRGGRFEAGINVHIAALVGNEFRVNGLPTTESGFRLGPTDVLTGTLQDGSPFVFSPLVGDDAFYALTASTVPTYGVTPIITAAPSNLRGVRPGQMVTVIEGGRLGRTLSVVDAALTISGGTVERGLEAYNSTVVIDSGYLGGEAGTPWMLSQARFIASDVRVMGGMIGDDIRLIAGSTLEMSGGELGSDVRVGAGSVLDLSGGRVAENLLAESGGQARLSGGVFGRRFRSLPGSVATLIGGEFLLNGVAPTGQTVAVGEGDILTGTFADGSAFVFSAAAADSIAEVELLAAPLPAIDTTPIVVAGGGGPTSIRAAQTVIAQDGGVLEPDFAAIHGTVVIDGGELASSAELYGSTLLVSRGSVADGLHAHSGSQLSVSGGSVGDDALVNSGSVLNVTGGRVGEGLVVRGGSVLNVIGGTVSERFRDIRIEQGSVANFTGGRVDGAIEAFDSVLNVGGGSLEEVVAHAGVSLSMTSGGIGKIEAEHGSDLYLPGGSVQSLQTATGSTTDIAGGVVTELRSAGRVQISSGSVGFSFSASYASAGGHVEVSGGSIGSRFGANAGSTVDISGGDVGAEFNAKLGSTVIVSGGSIGERFAAQSGSEVSISGGRFGRWFSARPGSHVTLSGGEFVVNGSEITDNFVTLAPSDVLSGTLEDGSVFVFSPLLGDSLSEVRLHSTAVPTYSSSPLTISTEYARSALRAGQSLTLIEGGQLRDRFFVVDATLNMLGGDAGDGLRIVDSSVKVAGGALGSGLSVLGASELDVSAGSIGDNLAVYGGMVNVSGGAIGDGLSGYGQSMLSISGGSVGSVLTAHSSVEMTGGVVARVSATDGSVGRITGGTVAGRLSVVSGSRVEIGGSAEVSNTLFLDSVGEALLTGGTVTGAVEVVNGTLTITGGAVQGAVIARHDGVVQVHGTSFAIDGVEIDFLELYTAFEFTDRNVTLSGMLTDGSAFSFDLNSAYSPGNDYFDSTATLTLVLDLPGDFNGDGLINTADYTVWRDNLNGSEALLGYRGNGDSVVGPADYDLWAAKYGFLSNVENLGTEVSEPNALLLALTGLIIFARRKVSSLASC